MGDNKTDNELRGYSREEIQKMLNLADLKYKAIILMLASSGMRREALVNLRVSDLKPTEHGLYKMKVYRSSQSKYTAFTSPEA